MRHTHHFDAVFDSPVGRLGIALDGDSLRSLAFLDGRTAIVPAARPVASRIQRAILQYFDKPAALPAVPLAVDGSAFQQRVWAALRAIPAGRVMTYGELAAQLGTGARAVGNACRHNPVPLVFPCHRVVPARGVGGFAGRSAGRLVAIQRQLLARAGVEIR